MKIAVTGAFSYSGKYITSRLLARGEEVTVRRLAESLHITFVIVTHELASIYAIADRVIMVDKRAQGIIAEGDPRVLRGDRPVGVRAGLHLRGHRVSGRGWRQGRPAARCGDDPGGPDGPRGVDHGAADG